MAPRWWRGPCGRRQPPWKPLRHGRGETSTEATLPTVSSPWAFAASQHFPKKINVPNTSPKVWVTPHLDPRFNRESAWWRAPASSSHITRQLHILFTEWNCSNPAAHIGAAYNGSLSSVTAAKWWRAPLRVSATPTHSENTLKDRTHTVKTCNVAPTQRQSAGAQPSISNHNKSTAID